MPLPRPPPIRSRAASGPVLLAFAAPLQTPACDPIRPTTILRPLPPPPARRRRRAGAGSARSSPSSALIGLGRARLVPDAPAGRAGAAGRSRRVGGRLGRVRRGGGGPGGPGGGPAAAAAAAAAPSTVGVAAATRADLPVVLDALGTVTPAGHRHGAAAGLGRAARRCCSPKARWSRRASCSRRIDPRPFEMALQQAHGARLRDEAQLEAARVTLAALPHAAAARTRSRARTSTPRPRWSSSSKAR